MKKINNSLAFCLVFVTFVSCFKAEKTFETAHKLCENPTELRKCPDIKGEIILPRNYPARSIYVGFSNDKYHLDFLDQLISLVSQLETKPMLNILVPRLEDIEAYDQLKKYFDDTYQLINLIPTSSNETVWAQDYMEILLDTKSGKSEIINLPYFGREGDYIPISVGLSCQKNMIDQPLYPTDAPLPGNGDYGGNIDALTSKVVMLGNNMTNQTYDLIEKSTVQKIVEVNVEWLETGHVDEIITTLPLKKNASDCDQALLVASPKVALDIVQNKTKDLNSFSSEFKPFYVDDLVWPSRDKCLLFKNQKDPDCIEFTKVNLWYERIIQKSLDKVQNLIQAEHGCRLKEIKFPQLFVPLEKAQEYGLYEDRAVPLNPNAVNNIFFYPYLVLPQQEFEPFQADIEMKLRNLPHKIEYTNSKFVHELNGGIHCATNISYACTP